MHLSRARARRHVNNISSPVFPCRCIFLHTREKTSRCTRMRRENALRVVVVVVHRDIRLAGENDRTQIRERTHARLPRTVRGAIVKRRALRAKCDHKLRKMLITRECIARARLIEQPTKRFLRRANVGKQDSIN